MIIIHTEAQLRHSAIKARNLHFIHVPVEDMARRLATVFDDVPVEGAPLGT